MTQEGSSTSAVETMPPNESHETLLDAAKKDVKDGKYEEAVLKFSQALHLMYPFDD